MKKILFVLFFSSFSYSQVNVTVEKTEKITFSEYDNLKYIQSLDEDFTFTDNIVRHYESLDKLSYSISIIDLEDKSIYTLIYPTSTIEYIIKSNTDNSIMTGTLKVNGANRFFTITNCNDLCYYWVFVNKHEVYKGVVKAL